MPKKSTVRKARKDKRRGKKPSTQAGEFIREEIDEVRSGKHGVANTKQAIAIGLAKARQAGVKIGDNPHAKSKKKKKKTASGRRKSSENSTKRAQASLNALKKKPRAGVSHQALSKHAKAVARRRKKK